MSRSRTILCLTLLAAGLTACTAQVSGPATQEADKAAAAPAAEAAATSEADAVVAANLKRFDQLDFDAYSNRKDMDLFRKLHCPDVKVVLPDGRETVGIDAHVDDINNIFFNGTTDSRITSHPIAFGQGEWTAAKGIIEATFKEPMKMPDGTSIPPTGKAVKMGMVTMARWTNGCIAEEHLFFDNAEYMRQLGLGK